MSAIPLEPTTPSPHEENAQAIMLELRLLTENIRGLTLLSTEGRRKLSTSGNVDDDFLRVMAVLIDATPAVAAPSVTGAQIRDHLHFSASHKDVGGELILIGKKVNDTLLSERSTIGKLALRALKIARSIDSPAERAALVPHLQAIEQNFTRGRRKRATTTKKEEPATAPNATTPGAGGKP